MATVPNFSQPAIFSEVSTPTAPDSGYLKVYAKSGALCSIANGGSEKAYATSGDLSSYLPLVGGTLVGDLLFTDATYDIGKSGATRPRDGFFSRNLTAGSQLTVPYGDSTNPSILITDSNTGIHGLNTSSRRIRFTVAGTLTAEYAAGAYIVDGTLQFASIGSSARTGLLSPDTSILEIRQIYANTTAQSLRLNNTWSSSTSFETLQFKANAGAAYQIGSAVGSAGGSNRNIEIGRWNSAGVFAQSITVYPDGGASIGGNARIMASWGGGAGCHYDADVHYFRNAGTNIMLAELNTTAFLLNRNTTVTQPASTTGSPTSFTLTGGAHTTLTASTEATDVNFNLARTVQFSTGALTTQRAVRIQAPTYAFVGASTLTTASTLSISGAPVAGTNATITNSYALNVESGNTFLGGDLLFTDATYDIGKSGATRPRDGFFSRNLTVGGVTTAGETSMLDSVAVKSGLFHLQVWSGGLIGWCSSTSASTGTLDTVLCRDTADTIAQRRSTTAQEFRLYTTFTSATSYERIEIKGKAGANFEIGPENGSAGGTLRGLTIGGYSAGSSTITPWLTFTNAGAATFATSATVTTNCVVGGELFLTGSIWSTPFATHGGWRIRRANGTSGSPTQVLNNDLLGFFAATGYHNGGAYHANQSCLISFVATEAFTSTGCGGLIRFATTANGTTTNTARMTIENSGVIHYARLMGQTNAEITSTPSGTTQTITLNDGNHQTLRLTSATGTVAVTLTVPSNVSSGTIIVIQHASTPRNITWAVSSGTVRWMGTQPTWSSDAVNAVRIVSWRYTGSVMYLMSTDVAT